MKLVRGGHVSEMAIKARAHLPEGVLKLSGA